MISESAVINPKNTIAGRSKDGGKNQPALPETDLPDAQDAQKENVAYDYSYHPLYIRKSVLSDYSPTLSAICHYHDDLEFMYLMKGHLSYYVNGATYQIAEGEGFFVNSGNLHYGYSADGTDCTFLCILLNPALISCTQYVQYHYVMPLVGNHAFAAQVLSNNVPWMRHLNDLLVKIYKVYSDKDTGFELMLQSFFYQIWLLLYTNMPENTAPNESAGELSVLRPIISFIQTHTTENITLPDIAAAGNVSSSYCCRMFKKYVQQSPMEYLRSCRLDNACTLLANPSISITEVSYRCGFSGTSYFIERFKEKYGVTPVYYRKHVIQQQSGK